MADPATSATSVQEFININHHNEAVNHIKQEDYQDENQSSWKAENENATRQHGHVDEENHHEHPDAPPAKRRKLAEVDNNHKGSDSRAISPPWKSIHAEGPASFLDNGKRRSARTNVIPLELQANSGRRQTRAAYGKSTEKHNRPVYNDSKKPKPETPKHAKTPSIDSPALCKSQTRASTTPVVKKQPAKKTPVKCPPQKEQTTSPKRKSMRIPPKSKRELLKEIKEIERAKRQLVNEAELTEDTLSDSDLSELSDASSQRPSPVLVLKKVSFKVQLATPTVTHPANIPIQRNYASFKDFVENDKLDDPAVRPPLSSDQIRKEAAKRLAVQQASLSVTSANTGLPTKQLEPKREYAHYDHLLAHASYFRLLMQKETRDHRRIAEVLAHEAKKYVEAKQAKGRVKTAEEIEQEQRSLWLGRFKTVVKDVARLWQIVEAEVNAARLRQYEQEQQEKIKGHLNRVLDRTNAMLKRHDTDVTDSEDEQTDMDEDSARSSDESESGNSEEMSASDVESETSEEAQDDDATMTVEQLRAKYENIPDLEPVSTVPPSEMETQDDEGEDSDPETIMDSELDSDEDDDEQSEAEYDEESEQDHGGLLSLFSKKEIEEMAPDPDGTDQDESPPKPQSETAMLDYVACEDDESVAKVEGAVGEQQASVPLIEEIPDAMDVDNLQSAPSAKETPIQRTPEPAVNEDSSSRDPSIQTSPQTSITKATEAESVSSLEQQHDKHQSQPPDDTQHKLLTPVSPLLRGTLREYQHEGLHWLANLYASGRSGILADEMGLGKTIQSIALLAHLATTYEVWGPHLVVVPTSVMLNWEMEFKKFLPGFKILTYYGDIKERKAKRRGWMADDSFNVVITSYQLVLQDANSFKRRRWHYMILDEAHNIKNFRSERWQTMMTFNTRARLLLTGTPLQNNLTELWSLLFFLHYGQESEGEDDAFADLREWSEWFKRPVESILEHGKQVLDQEDQEQVAKLHKVIRPFLLRRLKRDVEKQMPLKYEHVELCRLSKRQRQLYDGFMSRTQTRETLASGNYLSIINALMQLRKVCNHPDLFETRPINTSFAMPRSVAAEFEIKDLLVRRKLLGGDPFGTVDLDFLELVPISREGMSKRQFMALSLWNAYQPFRDLRERQWMRTRNRSKIFATADRADIMSSLESVARRARLQSIDRTVYYDAYKHHQHPSLGADLLKKLDLPLRHKELFECALSKSKSRQWERGSVFKSVSLVESLDTRSQTMQPLIEQYACITPAAVAIDFPVTVIGESRIGLLRQHQAVQKHDPFHQARMKLSIAFPDKRLLQYDCGKLQRLDRLLRELQSGGHRALIFTQMTKVLDILEQFLNIHGHRYLRLDGATKVEQRQALTDRFNNDTRILCFILSSRSGGLGINLTGADTVIFYDLDWNPAMDKQCTDRAHRIGQTRDVHIYRFVSEHTIESNILRKANQKQLLDDVVIQEGDFTTDYIKKLNYKGMIDDNVTDEDDVAGAAMDRVLGNKNDKVFEQAEDRDDVAAARVAEKEVEHADDGDFDEMPKQDAESKQNALGPSSATDAAIAEANSQAGIQHIDDYLLRVQRWLVKDVPLVIKDRDRSRNGRSRKRDARRR